MVPLSRVNPKNEKLKFSLKMLDYQTGPDCFTTEVNEC